jgi:spore coat protein H
VPVPVYDLTMDTDDLKWLRRHVGTARCFPAFLEVDSKRWPVWIGYRGNYSRWFRKPSYDIWFGEDLSFHGHARLHLNAAYRDPSMLRGRLALELFAELGVPTPRSWHVWLSLNDRPLGLYTAIESLDGGWLERRGMKGGSIYYAVGSKGNFGLLDPDTDKPKRYLWSGYEKCVPWDDDFSDLEQLIYQITLPQPAQFQDEINSVLHVETIVRWLIGIEFMSHTDGLVQNYALFHPPGKRWQISPWDCDGTFGRVPNGRIFHADEMALGTGEDNYLLARLLISPTWRQRYLTIWAQSLDGVLSQAHVGMRLDALWEEIKQDALHDDNKRHSNSTVRREPGRIRTYVKERTQFIRQKLLKARSRSK